MVFISKQPINTDGPESISARSTLASFWPFRFSAPLGALSVCASNLHESSTFDCSLSGMAGAGPLGLGGGGAVEFEGAWAREFECFPIGYSTFASHIPTFRCRRAEWYTGRNGGR